MRRWKVLIADDEFIIREGIKEAIEWEKYGIETIGDVEDGEEAVELAIAHQIDILLIDINMPIKNGIEAMKEIREKLPECKIIVISGYDDFHYAQEAIKVRVEEYLLKPIDPAKLEEIIKKVSKDLKQSEENVNYLEQVNQHIMKNEHSLKETFLKDWLSMEIDEQEIKKQLTFFAMPAKVPYSILLFSITSAPISLERKEEIYQLNELAKPHQIANDLAVYVEDSDKLIMINWRDARTHHQFLETKSFLENKLNREVVGDYIEPESLCLHHYYMQLKKELNKITNLPRLVKETIDYIQTNYTNKHLTLEEVAQRLHVTPVYLSKTIKKELGVTYVQIITKLRIKAAKNYLKTSNLSIREIADHCGYDSQHYFSTAFRKTVGLSPKQYREDMRS